jgi:flagellar hook-length control protein FliK
MVRGDAVRVDRGLRRAPHQRRRPSRAACADGSRRAARRRPQGSLPTSSSPRATATPTTTSSSTLATSTLARTRCGGRARSEARPAGARQVTWPPVPAAVWPATSARAALCRVPPPAPAPAARTPAATSAARPGARRARPRAVHVTPPPAHVAPLVPARSASRPRSPATSASTSPLSAPPWTQSLRRRWQWP